MGQEQVVSEESLEREDAFLLPVPVPSPWAQFIQQSCFKHRSDARLGPIAPGAKLSSPSSGWHRAQELLGAPGSMRGGPEGVLSWGR